MHIHNVSLVNLQTFKSRIIRIHILYRELEFSKICNAWSWLTQDWLGSPYFRLVKHLKAQSNNWYFAEMTSAISKILMKRRSKKWESLFFWMWRRPIKPLLKELKSLAPSRIWRNWFSTKIRSRLLAKSRDSIALNTCQSNTVTSMIQWLFMKSQDFLKSNHWTLNITLLEKEWVTLISEWDP